MAKKKKKTGSIYFVMTLVAIAAIVAIFLKLSNQNTYRVFSNNSPEVKAEFTQIKKYRPKKGYHIVREDGKRKLILISEGLTYGKDDSISVDSIEFEGNKAKISINSNVEKSPEKQVVNYPYCVIQINGNVSKFEVVNQFGNVYDVIDLNSPTIQTFEDAKEESDEDIEDEEEKDKNKEDKEEKEEEDEEEDKFSTMECYFQGKIDSGSIEVKTMDGNYTTMMINSSNSAFDNIDFNQKISISYISAGGSIMAIAVK